MRHEYKRNVDLFRRIPHENLYFVTLLIKVVYGGPKAVQREIQTFKRKFRNFMTHWKAIDPSFENILIRGRIEVDLAHAPSKLPVTNPTRHYGNYHKQLAINALGFDLKQHFPTGKHQTYWLIHYHGVAYLPNKASFGARLRGLKQFPGHRRVNIKRLYSNRSKKDNLKILTSYMAVDHTSV